jgi:hypothetical protein
MTSRELDLWVADGRGDRARMCRMVGRAAGIWVACVAGALLGASAASALPSGAVGGMQDPVSSGALELSVLANESEGVGLASAMALLDGEVVDEVPFEDGACRAGSDVGCPAIVPLTVPTASKADGTHRLEVIIEDELGRRFEWERSFEIDNTPPVSTPVVTVNVGSGSLVPSPPPEDGGGGTDPRPTERGCRAPRLSMFLAQSPLRLRRRVPVLAAGRRYRYTGRLTCRINGRRRAAPRGTLVGVRNIVNGRTVVKPSLKVRKNGVLVARLAYPSSRVIVFRVRGAGGDVVRVRIPIRVVKLRRGRT